MQTGTFKSVVKLYDYSKEPKEQDGRKLYPPLLDENGKQRQQAVEYPIVIVSRDGADDKVTIGEWIQAQLDLHADKGLIAEDVRDNLNFAARNPIASLYRKDVVNPTKGPAVGQLRTEVISKALAKNNTEMVLQAANATKDQLLGMLKTLA